ncbi:MAG: flagellar biosynthetic protein FliR [Lentisphaerota bacterium]
MDFQFGFFPQVFLLVLFRVLAILMPVMMYSRVLAPRMVMVALGLMLSLVLLPIVPPSWHQAAASIHNIPQMLYALLGEILLGSVIGLTLNMMLGVALLGGTVAGWGSSLMMAQSIDPSSGASDVVLSQLVQNTLIIIFLVSNGHLLVIKMLAVSFQTVPPDLSWLQAGIVDRLGRWAR